MIRVLGRAVSVGLALAAAGCDQGKKDTVWVQFNAPREELTVEVLAKGAEGGSDPVGIELHSNLGVTLVGAAEITPASAPVGSIHFLTVDVFGPDDGYDPGWAEVVGRVTVVTDSGELDDLNGDGEPDSREERTHELERDSADPGAWALKLQSQGIGDRVDTLTIELWQPEELEETTTVPTEE